MTELPQVVRLSLEAMELAIDKDLTGVYFLEFTSKDGRRINFVQDNTKIINDVRATRRSVCKKGGKLPPYMEWALE